MVLGLISSLFSSSDPFQAAETSRLFQDHGDTRNIRGITGISCTEPRVTAQAPRCCFILVKSRFYGDLGSDNQEDGLEKQGRGWGQGHCM